MLNKNDNDYWPSQMHALSVGDLDSIRSYLTKAKELELLYGSTVLSDLHFPSKSAWAVLRTDSERNPAIRREDHSVKNGPD